MINERVEVIVRFGGGKVIPVSFEWKNRKYEVKSVPMRFERRDGERKYLCFNVSTEGMMAELVMDRESFDWRIAKCEPYYI